MSVRGEIYGECVREVCEAERNWRVKSSQLIGQQQENKANRSSGVQVSRDFCTRFGRYLHSTKCSSIIRIYYPTLTKQAWSIKDLLCGIKHKRMICVLARQSPYPERARQLHLARSGSQSQREIRFILPDHGARQIINVIINDLYCWSFTFLGLVAPKGAVCL